MKIVFLIFLAFNFLFATFNLDTKQGKISEVTDQTAKLDIPNLQIGQSGIVIKNIDENSIILAQASVIKTDDHSSTIKFFEKKLLEQDALPTTTLKPSNGDLFILNHLYRSSLLIVPNTQAKNSILKLFPNQNFLDEDFFASYLKVENNPRPDKETIVEFAQSQEIGTVFIAVQNNLFILDALTFKVLDSKLITNDDKKTQVPFLTRIEEIKNTMLDFSANEIKNYDLYYLKLMEIIK